MAVVEILVASISLWNRKQGQQLTVGMEGERWSNQVMTSPCREFAPFIFGGFLTPVIEAGALLWPSRQFTRQYPHQVRGWGFWPERRAPAMALPLQPRTPLHSGCGSSKTPQNTKTSFERPYRCFPVCTVYIVSIRNQQNCRKSAHEESNQEDAFITWKFICKGTMLFNYFLIFLSYHNIHFHQTVRA